MPEGKWEHSTWEVFCAILSAWALFILKTYCTWPCSKASNPMIHWDFTLWGSVLSSNGKQAIPIKTCLKERKFHKFLLIDRSLINFGVKKFLYSSGTVHILINMVSEMENADLIIKTKKLSTSTLRFMLKI